MNKPNAIAIFDIGKTNKKLFVFDEHYNILLEESWQIDEITDDDGYPCENLQALSNRVIETANEVFSLKDLNVKAVNFSAYGASFVHMDKGGRPVCPLYNYLKPYPAGLQKRFYDQYGPEEHFSLETASPVLGSLNSGLQLYRIRHEKPETFNAIDSSLHLPQYISFLITQKRYSDITSIGCHSGLWNFAKNDYHDWVYKEGINEKLPPVFPSGELMQVEYGNRKIFAGCGLHDSSAALIPYSASFPEPFLLISTGTWCISLNPFNHTGLTADELKKDGLCYLGYKGEPVKAARLFAGYRHDEQVKRLASHFSVQHDFYKTIQPDPAMLHAIQSFQNNDTPFSHIDLNAFSNCDDAYHLLIYQLVKEQVNSTNLIMGNSRPKSIYVDGGFAKNQIYMQLLANAYPGIKVSAASVSQATALGAALAVHQHWNPNKIPANVIELKPFVPFQNAGHSPR